jgi:hypothetical protein
MKNSGNNWLNLGGILLGLCLSAGLIISTAQLSRVWLHIADSQLVTVTGAAYEDVSSDLAIWSADFSTESETLAGAEQQLKTDSKKVEEFFKEQGVTNAEISAISIQRLKAETGQFAMDDSSKKTIGYHLQQTLRLESPDINQVIKMQQLSTTLVEQGVELDDQGIQFIYTKTAEAKIDMLAAATRDARQRAEQIATQGGRKIKELKSAKMGVFQITAIHSNETSSEGVNDTTSKGKSIRAVISASFTME